MTERQRQTLPEPPAGSLEGLPPWEFDATGLTLYRLCGSSYTSPWYFSNDDSGRFNLVSGREGTCYWGTTLSGSILEVLGPELAAVGVLSARWFEEKCVWSAELTSDIRIADLANIGARQFGVTLELFTITPYVLPQRWASEIRECGWEGIRYLLRHEPSGASKGIALFGPRGAQDSHEAAALVAKVEFDEELLGKFTAETGVQVLETPISVDSFRIVEPE